MLLLLCMCMCREELFSIQFDHLVLTMNSCCYLHKVACVVLIGNDGWHRGDTMTFSPLYIHLNADANIIRNKRTMHPFRGATAKMTGVCDVAGLLLNCKIAKGPTSFQASNLKKIKSVCYDRKIQGNFGDELYR